MGHIRRVRACANMMSHALYALSLCLFSASYFVAIAVNCACACVYVIHRYSDELSAALQLRPCKGYHVPRMAVIPPG